MNKELEIKVSDSVRVTQRKRLEKVEKMLPDGLIADYGHYFWNNDYIGIGDPIKVGVIFRHWTYQVPYIYVTYSNVKVNHEDYFDLAMKIARELEMDEVIKEYEDE